MASYEKRGKTWQFTVSRYINGKYKPIRQGGFKTKREAVVVATEIENQLNKGKVLNLTPIPFHQYFYEWVKLYKVNLSDNTMERYLNTYETIKIHFKNKNIQDINKRDYQAFLNDYAKTRHKETVKKLNSQIRACVSNAIDEGVIFQDFTRNAVLGGKQTQRGAKVFLDYKDSVKLKNYLMMKTNQLLTEKELIDKKIDLRYFAILLALQTGIRFGEIVGLTKEDFDFVNETLSINKIWGYASKMEQGFSETKNREHRKLKVGKKTLSIFKELFKHVIENENNLVFYEPLSKYKVISNSGTNDLLRLILKKLGLREISIHGLRHTHVSVLIHHNISILYIAERLGHSSIETTYKHYSHMIKELKKKDEKKTVKIFD